MKHGVMKLRRKHLLGILTLLNNLRTDVEVEDEQFGSIKKTQEGEKKMLRSFWQAAIGPLYLRFYQFTAHTSRTASNLTA